MLQPSNHRLDDPLVVRGQGTCAQKCVTLKFPKTPRDFSELGISHRVEPLDQHLGLLAGYAAADKRVLDAIQAHVVGGEHGRRPRPWVNRPFDPFAGVPIVADTRTKPAKELPSVLRPRVFAGAK